MGAKLDEEGEGVEGGVWEAQQQSEEEQGWIGEVARVAMLAARVVEALVRQTGERAVGLEVGIVGQVGVHPVRKE